MENNKRDNAKKTVSSIHRLSLENGIVIENSTAIANNLNQYFVSVGPNLAEKFSK